ncbi:MAG: peptidyl-prolyl cis-trans isomerase, partial [Gammaproteobacteria bacterium]
QSGAGMGLRVRDDDVRRVIESLEAFQGGSGFDTALYESRVSLLGLSSAGFEQQVRDEMGTEQLQSALIETDFTTDDEVRNLAQLRAQSRVFWYAILSADAAKEGIEVSEPDVRAYYEEHSDQYLTPEQIRVSYIELSIKDLAAEVSVSEEDLRRHYEENRGGYGMEEQREVRQLLVPLPDGVDAAAVEQARSKASALVEKLRAGTSMKDLVEADRQSAESNLEYSEFGLLGRDILEPEVEKVVFSMNEGEFSDPIQSRFGIHIVQVATIREGTVEPFESVRDDVEADYRRAEADRRFVEISDRLLTLTFEHPDSLEPAAEELGLPIRESELFSRQAAGSEFLTHPKIQAAAFSEEVLQNRNNSDLIELDSERAVVLRVSDHVPEGRQPLGEVRDRIITRIKFERARDRMIELGEEILVKLHAGVPRDGISGEYEVAWQEAGDVRLDDPGVNRAVMRAAFRMARPRDAQAEYDGVSLGSGDYAVVALEDVTQPAADSLAIEELNAVRSELKRTWAEGTWARFLADLKQRADVKVFADNVQ